MWWATTLVGHNCITTRGWGIGWGVRRQKKVAAFMGEWCEGALGVCVVCIRVLYHYRVYQVGDRGSWVRRQVRSRFLIMHPITTELYVTTNYKLQITGVSTSVWRSQRASAHTLTLAHTPTQIAPQTTPLQASLTSRPSIALPVISY